MTKRRVLITGASAGAGRAIAARFAEEGYDLFLVARRASLLADVRAELEATFGINVITQVCDLTKETDVLSLYENAAQAGISVMINNAGLGDWNFVWDLSLEKLNSMIDLNARALAILSTLFVRDKKDTDACLINVASLAGYSVFGAAVPYSATKYFATVFTEGLIHDLRSIGSPMRVKVMAPGPIDTEFTSISLAETKLPPMDASEVKFHTPEEIAEFTYQLFMSDMPAGLVNLNDMTFVLQDLIHPYGSL
ncbi:MAG: SDR family NAD(P)-dependent oxidoreductase [Pseudomonadales bacterium]|nr:SDR family NAD(P)-dependent oxidoreductase [Pseudomonadales bacterium]